MSVKVFVLGRPGSGKTTAVRQIVKLANRRNYPTRRMKDYDILYEMFQDDIEHERHDRFCTADYGAFSVLDFSVLDVALEQLEKSVQTILSAENKEIVLIEFARDDYRNALSKFSPEFLQDAYFFFVDSGVETCIQRIHRRVTTPPRPDDHFISDDIMRSYYDKDNWDYMTNELKQKYGISKEVVTFHNIGALTEYITVVSDFAELIFHREFIMNECSEEHNEGICLPDVMVDVHKTRLYQRGPLADEPLQKEFKSAQMPYAPIAISRVVA